MFKVTFKFKLIIQKNVHRLRKLCNIFVRLYLAILDIRSNILLHIKC